MVYRKGWQKARPFLFPHLVFMEKKYTVPKNLTDKSRERPEIKFLRCYDLDIGSEPNGLDSGYVIRD